MPERKGIVQPELEDVAEQIGEFIEYFGFKKVHGRIWTHLFLSPVPLDATAIMCRLKVSKALVSMSISDLLEYDVIQVDGKCHHGTVAYVVNPNITTVISNVLRQRERRLISRISSSVKLLHDLPKDERQTVPICQERIDCLTNIVSTAEQTLDALLSMTDVNLNPWQSFNNKCSSLPKHKK